MLPDFCWQSTTSFSINTGLSINQVSWNFGDPNSGGSNTSMSLNPSHSFSNVGTYAVSALVEFQCYTDTLELTLTLVDCPQDPPAVIPDSPLLIPNVISPNNDGLNDLFEIDNLQENTEVIILNRWGNVVFSSTNYQNNWDGKDTSGKELADGVYTYKYKTKDAKIGHGFLHLVR
jgi:gliding motility-associated-like protein